MANGKEIAQYNENAISIKRYLNSDGIKQQIMAAAPKMLNGERFLKVFYGAMLRNPKLMECTTESMLQAAMFFAQLGLEPILGRAYLVPYKNRKNIEGRWVQQYEVQAQVGYQGFVDLGRRSGLILDVWGSCVYENDLFDLSYGLDRALVHKPWFMDPAKRKAGEPGDFLGAYVVWKLKDGTMHPDFMPAFEINKRRAKSQSYTWAETGDPTKGGGKQDSVWHQWPEEMALKTVIKHSAKLVPASIEFMQAIEFDDSKDNGAGFGPLTNYEFGDGPPKIEAPTADFDTLAQEKSLCWPNEAWDVFIQEVAKGNGGIPLEDFKRKVMAENRFADLWAAYERSFEKKPPQAAPLQAPPAKKQPADELVGAPYERKNWINLRGAGYAAYIEKYIESFKQAPKEVLSEARGKWLNIYKGEKPWPLDGAALTPAPQPAQALPEQEGNQQSAAPPQEDAIAQEMAFLLSQLDAHSAVDDGIYVIQAQRELRYSVGLQYIEDLRADGNVDAVRELLEKTEEIMAKRMA